MKLILCSQSPRRKELLGALGWPFTVRTAEGIDESFPPGLSPGETALAIARKKAAAYAATRRMDEVLVTADTIVCLDGEVLGKPRDEADAIRMLRMLSGRVHEVATGVCIVSNSGTECFAVVTEVEFAQLTDETIWRYVQDFRPLDKAGAYGVQEYIGYIGVTQMAGSYFNVMGFPICRVYEQLQHYPL